MHLVMAEDSIGRRFATGEVVIYDHLPGQPHHSRASLPRMFVTPQQRAEAMKYFRGPSFQSDIVIYEGYEWNFPDAVSTADTTFVAASGNRQWVTFGEASQTHIGRVIMWGPPTRRYHGSKTSTTCGTTPRISFAG
jgi:hypothetical protein